MAFTYDATLSTTLAKVRRLIGDTDSANALFTDAEMNFFIDAVGDNMYRAAAMATRAIAASKNLLARRTSISTYSEDYGSVVTDLLAQADRWERMAAASAGTVAVTRVDAHSSTLDARTL